MAKSSDTKIKLISIALLVTGVGLVLWGFQLSGSVGSKITQVITGSDTDKVMTFYILGAVSFFTGLYLFKKK